MFGPEEVAHRCATLSSDEAAELLSTYRTTIENPPVE
jgi:hypothetical protein